MNEPQGIILFIVLAVVSRSSWKLGKYNDERYSLLEVLWALMIVSLLLSVFLQVGPSTGDMK